MGWVENANTALPFTNKNSSATVSVWSKKAEKSTRYTVYVVNTLSSPCLGGLCPITSLFAVAAMFSLSDNDGTQTADEHCV